VSAAKGSCAGACGCEFATVAACCWKSDGCGVVGLGEACAEPNDENAE